MSKKEHDVDSDDIYEFDGFEDFDSFSPEVEKAGSNSRKPISTSYVGIGKAIAKGAASEVVSRSTMKRIVDKALPSEFGEVLGQANKAAGLAKTLQDDAVKTLKPHGQRVVRQLDKLVTKEDTRTRRLLERAKRTLGLRDGYQQDSEDEIQNQFIANELNTLFKTQEVTDNIRAAKAETDNRRRESVQNQQFNRSFKVSTEMAEDVASLRRYNDEIGQYWQRKMLELSYRQSFLHTRQVQLLEEGNQAILKQLESIVHNTALPEFSKITLSESWRENSRNKLIDVGNRALFGDGDWMREGMGRLRAKFQSTLSGAAERLAGGADSIDMMLDAKAQFDELGSMMSPQELAEQKARMAGALATGWVLDSTVGKLRKYVPKSAAEYPAMILNKLANGRQTLSDLGRTKFAQDNEWEGGVRGMAARTLKAIGSSFDKQDPDTTLSTGHDVSALGDPSMSGIDNRTKITINDVLPGYLARMLQQLQISNGDKSAQLLLYDVRSSKFKQSREILRDVNRRMMDGYASDTQRYNANSTLSKFAANTYKQSDRKSIREAETFLMDYAESGGRLELAAMRESKLYEALSRGAMALIDDMMSTVEQDDLPQQAQRQLFKRLERIRESGYNSASDMQRVLTEGHGWALEELGYGRYDRDGNFERDNDRAVDLSRNWGTRIRETNMSRHEVIRGSVAKPLTETKDRRTRDADYRRKLAYFRDCDAMTLGIEGVGWEHFKHDRMFLRMVEDTDYKAACDVIVTVLRDAYGDALDPKELARAEREIRKLNNPKRKGDPKSKDDAVGVGEDGVADSDINLKEDIKQYDPNTSLSQLRKTNIFNWRYKQDGVKRTGPMAQDVQRHMGNGTAPRGRAIDLVSLNGKTMAAVKALDARLTAKLKILGRGDSTNTNPLSDLMTKTFGPMKGGLKPVEPTRQQTDNELLTSIDRRIADLVSLTKLSIDLQAGGSVQIKGLFRGLFDGAYNRFQVGSKWLKDKLGTGMGWAKDKWDETEDGREELRGRVRKGLRRGLRKGMVETKRTLFKRLPSFNRTVQGWLQPYYDLYVKPDLENPVLYGNLLNDGQYVDAKTGDVLKFITDIRGPVKDLAGNYVLTKRDFAKGIVNARGEPVSFKWQGWTDLASNAGNAIRRAASRIGQFVLDKLQSVQDVYVKGEVEARLTAAKMEAGVYIDKLSGKVIRSIADIKGEVVDTAGNIVLSAQDFAKGLLDRHGEELQLKFRNVRDLVTTGLRNGIAKGAKVVGFVSDMARLGYDAIRSTLDNARESWGVGTSAEHGKTMSDTLLEIRAILQTHMGPADPDLMPKINSKGEFVGPPKPNVLQQLRRSFKARFGNKLDTLGRSGTPASAKTDVEGIESRESDQPDQVGSGGFAAGAGIIGAFGEARDYLQSKGGLKGLRGRAHRRFRNTRLGKLVSPDQSEDGQSSLLSKAKSRMASWFGQTPLTPQQELKARLMAKHGHKLKPKEPEGEGGVEAPGKLAQLRDRMKGTLDRFRSKGQENEAKPEEGKDQEKKPGLWSRVSEGIQNYRSRDKAEEPRKQFKYRKPEQDYRDHDGDGKREGHYLQRKAEMEARAKANRKELLAGQTQAKYTEGGVFQQLWGLVKNLGGMIGSVFSGISGLVSGVGSFLGIGGAAGGLLSKLGGFLGAGAKGKGVLDAAAGIGQAANATQKAGMLGRAIGAVRTVGAPIANIASKAAPALRVVASVGNVVGAFGGIAGLAGSAVSVGATILSAALSSPFILGAAAVAATGYGLYRTYKYFTRNSTDAWQDIRVKQYGLRNDDADKQFVSPLMELEGYMLDGRIIIGSQGAEILHKRIDNAEVLQIFGADPEDEPTCRAIGVFMQQRFLPFLLNAVNAAYAADPKTKLTQADKMSPEAKLKFLAKLGYESGPYHISVSPFKDLSKLFDDKSLAVDAIKKLQTSIEETAAKDKDKKNAADAGRSDAVQMNRDLEAARKAKAEAQAKAAAAARREQNVNAGANRVQNAVVPPMGSGQGDGQRPTRSGTGGGQGITNVGAPPSANGPVLAGVNASQYLKLASGVSLSGMNPTLLKYLNGMAEEYGRATGKPILIKDGFRTYEQQLAVYNKFRGQPGRAAKPGNSLHEFGLALDMEPADAAKLEQMGLMRKYGFTRPVGGEDWHVEPAGIQGAITNARNDSSLASSMIAAGLGKGGGGYGTMPGAEKYRRNDDLARRLLGLPGRPPVETMNTPVDDSRTVRPVTQGGTPVVNRPPMQDNTRPAMSRGTGSPVGMMPVYGQGGQGDGNRPAGWTGGNSGATMTDPPKPTGGRDLSKINRNASVLDIIRQTAKSIGADPERLATFAAIESGLDPRAVNAKTGARGLYQFLDSTWNDHIRKAAKKYDLGNNPSPEDPVASTIMAHDYMNSYVKSVSSNPTATDMYLVHFLGPTGARKFMSLAPDAIAASALPKAAKNNPDLFYQNGRALSKAEIYNLITSRIQARARQFGITSNVGSLMQVSTPTPNSRVVGATNPIAPTGAPARASDYATDSSAVPRSTPSNRGPQPYAGVVQSPVDSGVDVNRQSGGVSMTRTNALLQDSVKIETLILEELKKLNQRLSASATAPGKPTVSESPATKQPVSETKVPANGMTNGRSKPSSPAAQPGPTPISLARGAF